MTEPVQLLRVYRLPLKSGFTLIELLTVIAVVGILASMIVTTITKAKNRTHQVVCLNNIRQQYLAQMLFVGDNVEQFPAHNDDTPSHHRSPRTVGRSFVDHLKPHYLRDYRITICPFTSRFYGKIWPQWQNPDLLVDRVYGGWGTSADYVSTSYMWLANYPSMKFLASDGTYSSSPVDGELPWPKTSAESDSRRAFITHRIAMDTTSKAFIDLGHSGFMAPKGWNDSKVRSQPIGHADGSVLTRMRSQILPRATGGLYNETYYY